jgi:hypothetical protein
MPPRLRGRTWRPSRQYRDPPNAPDSDRADWLKFLARFERLASWAERGRPAPRSQCIPVGGTIVDHPASIGRPTVYPDGGPLVQVEDDGNHNGNGHDTDDDDTAPADMTAVTATEA